MLLDHKVFFVKEQVEFLKLAGTYDIFEPTTNQQIGVAKEEPKTWVKILKPLIGKAMLPTKVSIYDSSNSSVVFTIVKPFSFIRSKVIVYDVNGESLGYFKSKIITISGGFWVFDPNDKQVAEVKGEWKGWNFSFIGENNRELGTVTKKWAGLAKELFTSADNYVITLNDQTGAETKTTMLLLAAGIALDMIFKEDKK